MRLTFGPIMTSSAISIPPKIIKGAVLIDEDVAPDAGIGSAGRINRRYERKTVVHQDADKITERVVDLNGVVLGQTIEGASYGHRAVDFRRHSI